MSTGGSGGSGGSLITPTERNMMWKLDVAVLSLSCAASLGVVLCFAVIKKIRTFKNQLIFFLCLCDCLNAALSISNIVYSRSSAFPACDGWATRILLTLMNTFFVSSVLWVVYIALYMFFRIVHLRDLKINNSRAHATIWLCAIAMSFPLLAFESTTAGTATCWTNATYEFVMNLSFPILCVAVEAFFYFSIIWEMRKTHRKVAETINEQNKLQLRKQKNQVIAKFSKFLVISFVEFIPFVIHYAVIYFDPTSPSIFALRIVMGCTFQGAGVFNAVAFAYNEWDHVFRDSWKSFTSSRSRSRSTKSESLLSEALSDTGNDAETYSDVALDDYTAGRGSYIPPSLVSQN